MPVQLPNHQYASLIAERDAFKAALQLLDGCNWLDADSSDTEELAVAKRAARTALHEFGGARTPADNGTAQTPARPPLNRYACIAGRMVHTANGAFVRFDQVMPEVGQAQHSEMDKQPCTAQARKEELYLNPGDIDMIAAPWMAPDGQASASDVQAIVRAAISFCHDIRHMNPPQPGHRWVQVLVAAQEPHPDDAAVDQFAATMKAKLAKKRAHGRGGWQTADEARLSTLLHEHVAKGDPVDVGNLAMMLHQNGQRIIAAYEPVLTGGGEPFAWAYKLTPLDSEWTVTRNRPRGHQIMPLFTGVAQTHPISGRT